MDFRNFAKSSLEVLPRFILHSPVLYKASEVALALAVLHPAKFVDITGENKRASGLESKPLTGLYLGFERVQPHAVDCILESSILATDQTNISPYLSRVAVLLTPLGSRCPFE